MMKPAKISKILVPIDGSKNSWRALNHAIMLAKATDSKITGLCVVPTVQESEFKSSSVNKEGMKTAAGIVERAQKYSEHKGVTFKTRIDCGHIGYCIIKHAHSKSQNFGLLVIGSRGKGMIRKMIFGSTSNYVITESKIPVLVVK